ncbi:cytochrome bc1 complex diheme cytochrome c subunit [Nakamurella endophytica]|uniref:Cytochrome bc1 complex cytochrome c subunit n=1 Tax=Nakamurella endophytica TaxID=1748367 RepID=A0A917WLE0_9ACTN|nr:cytochrome c [Nakamurella endophytica]GGM12715.1 putative ubiquinol-cytochrome c reductase cytochrome c subunit [Nakamurella endophytica]
MKSKHRAAGAEAAARPPRGRRIARRSKLARRISGGLALLFALVAMGLAYSAFSPAPQTAQAADIDPAKITAGKSLYTTSCITCHGANLQGVLTRGPSLIGVGQAAVYFQVMTGRMPAVENGAQMPRKDLYFDETEVDQLSAYIESVGGGPAVPAGDLQNRENLARGSDLYRLNCASCHNYTGQGGALSQGKYAPPLDQATDQVIYSAMLSGPEQMPKFSDGQLTPDEKKSIIAYIQNTKQTIDPGGYNLGGFGPAPEGLAAFIVGMGAIVALTLWMGSKA